jgi:hypothetical protein
MLLEQALQIQGGRGEVFQRKGHVLDDDGGAHPADGAHRRKEPFADVPQPGVVFHRIGELHGQEGGRALNRLEAAQPAEIARSVGGGQGNAVQGLSDGRHVALQFFLAGGPRLHQKSGGSFRQVF